MRRLSIARSDPEWHAPSASVASDGDCSRDRERPAGDGRASERSYARGGGSSGSEPEDAGINTANVYAAVAWTGGTESDTVASAPSAVVQGMEARHDPGAGPEHGGWPDDVPCAAIALGLRALVALVAPSDMPTIGAITPCAAGPPVPAMACMPGTTHTAPPVTILRWPTKRTMSRSAERRMRWSIT